MHDTLDLGIPGFAARPGDHVCALYLGADERDRVLLPFVRTGLHAGDKCVCILNTDGGSDPMAWTGQDVDWEGCRSTRQLEVLRADEAYLRSGRFSSADMIAFLDESISGAVGGDGYAFARVVGEMTWVLGDPPGAEELLVYESELNDFAPRYPQVLLCLYDLEQFGGALVVDLLRTHPKLLLNGMVFENPHYVRPDELFRSSRS